MEETELYKYIKFQRYFYQKKYNWIKVIKKFSYIRVYLCILFCAYYIPKINYYLYKNDIYILFF